VDGDRGSGGGQLAPVVCRDGRIIPAGRGSGLASPPGDVSTSESAAAAAADLVVIAVVLSEGSPAPAEAAPRRRHWAGDAMAKAEVGTVHIMFSTPIRTAQATSRDVDENGGQSEGDQGDDDPGGDDLQREP
jgi:hypothetical protein